MKKLLFLLVLIPIQHFAQCDSSAIFAVEDDNAVCIEIIDKVRYVYANNWPNHGPGNLNSSFTLTAFDDTWTVCGYPELGTSITQLYGDETIMGCSELGTYRFGVGVNGVRYDPNSAEFFEDSSGEENYDWHVEAVAALNVNNQGAHLNPFGEYHYHNVSTPYFTDTGGVSLGIDGTSFSPIIGYAADGYPIYYKYAYTNANDNGSGISAFDSGWELKSGIRPGDGLSAPDGAYDGLYVEDYEFVQSNTELDECNGRFGVTPDFPDGTYYYILTDSWPYIPRCFAGAHVDQSFLVGPSNVCPDSTSDMDCSAQLLSVTDTVTDLEEVIAVYPIPTSDILYINFPSGLKSEQTTMSLFDSNGNRVRNFKNHNESSIDLSSLAVGNYFLQIVNGELEMTKKIIKE